MESMIANSIKFSGQHADEFVISEIKPSRLVLRAKLIYQISLGLIAMLVFWAANTFLLELIGDYRLIGLTLIALATGTWSWIYYSAFNKLRTYLTDRRIVNFEASSPFSPSKKSLFWREVTRVKDSEKFSFWNLFKVGNVQVVSYDSTESAEIILPYVERSQDLTNYIDKLIFSFKQNPDTLGTMPPFEPNPTKRVYHNAEN